MFHYFKSHAQIWNLFYKNAKISPKSFKMRGRMQSVQYSRDNIKHGCAMSVTVFWWISIILWIKSQIFDMILRPCETQAQLISPIVSSTFLFSMTSNKLYLLSNSATISSTATPCLLQIQGLVPWTLTSLHLVIKHSFSFFGSLGPGPHEIEADGALQYSFKCVSLYHNFK